MMYEISQYLQWSIYLRLKPAANVRDKITHNLLLVVSLEGCECQFVESTSEVRDWQVGRT